MPVVAIVQNSWAAGEMSPRLTSRHDSDNSKYHAGAQQIENFLPTVEGPLIKRWGTRFVREVKNSAQLAYLLPFVYGNDLSYVIEGGNGYFRLHKDRTYTGVELATPYSPANILAMQTAQAGRIEWLASGAHDLRWLQLSDAGVFSLKPARTEPPPTLEQDTLFPGILLAVGATSGSNVTVYASEGIFKHSDVGREIVHAEQGRMTLKSYVGPIQMTANITESFANVNLLADEWVMKGSPVSTLVVSDSGPPGAEVELRLTGDVPGAAELVVNGNFAGGLTSWTNNSFGTGTAAPGAGCALLSGGAGTNGMGWISQGITTAATEFYLLRFSVAGAPAIVAVGAGSAGQSDILPETTYPLGTGHEVVIEALTNATHISFKSNQATTTAVSNISMKRYSRSGWREQDLGKYVYVRGGIVKITAIPGDALARGVVLHGLTRLEEEVAGDRSITSGAGAWTLQAPIWGPERGYARAVALHGQRLFLDGGAAYPLTVVGSVAGDFSDFGLGDSTEDGIHQTVSSDQVNALHWFVSSAKLIAGAEHAAFMIGGSATQPLSDQAFFVDPADAGSAVIKPVKTEEGLVVYVDETRRKVMVLAYDAGRDTLAPDDLTVLSEHITESGVKWLSYNRGQRLVWIGLNNNSLISLTINAKQGVFALVRHPMRAGDAVEHGVTIPVEGRHETYLVVRRTIGGVARRYIEVVDEVAGHWGQAVTDSSVTGTVTAATTISGLSHLNGAAVSIVVDGLCYPEQVVAGGAVSFAYPVTGRYEIGLAIRSKMRLLKPTIRGELGAIHAGTQVSVGQVYVAVQDAAGLMLSKDGEKVDDMMDFRAPGGVYDDTPPLVSGVEVFQPEGGEGDVSEDGAVTLLHDIATPCMIKEVVRMVYVPEPREPRR